MRIPWLQRLLQVAGSEPPDAAEETPDALDMKADLVDKQASTYRGLDLALAARPRALQPDSAGDAHPASEQGDR
ncbi:hypothetical protein BE17_50520 [Sorangium cellulosum]|uniref:Uncharacterized protein n=1 Tax=Sorangium cellulosum TaxID=56 RepID=A0A150RLN0_SORCE|nr:hypothetical protein BE17_50520 [Sorangium cellulosum]